MDIKKIENYNFDFAGPGESAFLRFQLNIPVNTA